MTIASNPHRSEAVIVLGGAPVTLRLSLAALAEIEEALGASTLIDLAEKLARPSAGQLIAILRAVARAGGAGDLGAIEEGTVCLREVMGAVTLLFREMLTGEAPGKPTPSGRDGGAG